jgi:hypothetical protein
MADDRRRGWHRRARLTLPVCGLAWLAACHHSPEAAPTPEPQAGRHYGAFEMRANLSGEDFSALMIVAADTVLFSDKGKHCRPVLGPSDPRSIRYECFGVGRYERMDVTIDRASPVQRSAWRATRIVRRAKQVCVRYRLAPNGQQVCAQYETQYDETTATDSGMLEMIRNVERPVEMDSQA